MASFDILIQGGTIIDGSGKPRFQGDVGVSGGRIRDIGNPSLAGAKAAKIIDATGKYVTPGFIDITSHADQNWSLFRNPEQDYLLTQGVTSILVGNCGSSLAPLVSAHAFDSFRKWNPIPEANVNWATLGEFLSELARRPLGVNVATLVGHGTIRRGILKGEARAMNDAELAEFIGTLERSIAEGAFGMSSGLAYSHESSASEGELIRIAGAVARSGGIYKTHIRQEGRNFIAAINEAIHVGREAKVRILVSHLKAVGRTAWPFFGNALTMIDRANEEGLSFHFDLNPYQRTGSFLYLLLPVWARAGGFAEMLNRLADTETSRKVIQDLKRQTLHYDRYITANAPEPTLNGKTIVEVAERIGKTSEEAVLDLLSANRGRAVIFGKTLSFRNIEEGIKNSHSIIASNGSGVSTELGKSGILVHPRSTGAFPHFLHRFVEEKKLVPWEAGIRKITSLPAELVGFRERGRIEKGYHADIAVIDPATIRDRSTYQNPYVHPVGVAALLVNGKLAVGEGKPTGVGAGEVLKKVG